MSLADQAVEPSTIRPAHPNDVPAVVSMVHELAGFERASERCGLITQRLTAGGGRSRIHTDNSASPSANQ